MRYAVTFWVVLAVGSVASAQGVPADVSSLAVKAGLQSPVLASCRIDLGRSRPAAYAVAVASPGAAGRYLVLTGDATPVELGTYRQDKPDLSCYTPTEAKKLDKSISGSETVEGHIAPRWGTTVVCGFVENTTSVCWQYSPADSKFVQVGSWIT